MIRKKLQEMLEHAEETSRLCEALIATTEQQLEESKKRDKYMRNVHAAADQLVKESMEIDGKMAVRLPVFTALQKALKGEE